MSFGASLPPVPLIQVDSNRACRICGDMQIGFVLPNEIGRRAAPLLATVR